MDESRVNLSQQQVSDLKRRFYLTGYSSRQETDADHLQFGVLSYNDNLVDFYFQGILLQHHHYALVLTEGIRQPDTVMSDRANQAADVFRGISHPVVQAPIAMADKFIALLKQQETRSDLSLALAYANLQLTRLEFAVASRLLAAKISYNYRENAFSAIQASAQAKALVKRIEVGLLMYSNPYSAIPVMGMDHDRLKTIYPDLPDVSIRRVASVVPYLLFLVHDTSLTPSLINRVVSTFSSLLDPIEHEARQNIDAQEIVIQPAADGEWMGLYIKQPLEGGRLPSVNDYTWEMREQHIDFEQLPKRIVAWNGVKKDLQQSIKLSLPQTEQVLAHWLTDKMVEQYVNTSMLGSCFVDAKHEKDTMHLNHLFKKMIYDYLIAPNGGAPAHEIIRTLMEVYDGGHLLSRTLEDMAGAFTKQFREVMKHRLIALGDGVELERMKKNADDGLKDIIVSTKSLPLSHARNARLKEVIDFAIDEAQNALMRLNQTRDLRLIAVSRVSAPRRNNGNKGKFKGDSLSGRQDISRHTASSRSSARSVTINKSSRGEGGDKKVSYVSGASVAQQGSFASRRSSSRRSSRQDESELNRPDWR